MSTKQILSNMLEALMNDDNEAANEYFNQVSYAKGTKVLHEDHENYMSSEELAHYLKTLHGKAATEHKDKVMGHMTKAAGMDAKDCTGDTFSKCAGVLSKNKVKADKLIHKLEALTGHAIDPKEYKKDKEKGESDKKAEKDSFKE